MLKFLTNHVRFTSLFKAMVYLALFSAVYGAGQLWLMKLPSGIWVGQLVQSAWLAAYGLGLYFVCCNIWGLRKGTLSWPVALGLSGFLWIFNTLVSWLSLFNWQLTFGQSSVWSRLPAAILGLLLLLFGVPCLFLVMRALYEGKQNPKAIYQFVQSAWHNQFGKLLNTWLLWLLVLLVWDNFFGGPLFLMPGWNALGLFANLIFLKEPFFNVLLLVSNSSGQPGMVELTILWTMASLAALVVESNLIAALPNILASKKKR